MAETRTERASCKVTFNEPKKVSRTGLLISSLTSTDGPKRAQLLLWQFANKPLCHL
jgi:hypothetical protein